MLLAKIITTQVNAVMPEVILEQGIYTVCVESNSDNEYHVCFYGLDKELPKLELYINKRNFWLVDYYRW